MLYTQGQRLRDTVARYTPEYTEELSGVPAATLRAAAEVIGKSNRLLSTALQGVYQSNQATAAACQINSMSFYLFKRGGTQNEDRY
jgi:ferredoxin-nitrate reductase